MKTTLTPYEVVERRAALLFSALAVVAFLLFAGMVGAGCQTGPEKVQTCEESAALYQAYQASLETGRPVSKEEIVAATSAGAFLRWYCGWTNPVSRGLTGAIHDAHGVPVLKAP